MDKEDTGIKTLNGDSPVDMLELIRNLTSKHPEAISTLESFGYVLPEPDAPVDAAPVDGDGVGALGEDSVDAVDSGDSDPLAADASAPSGPSELEDVSPNAMKDAKQRALDAAFKKRLERT